MRRNMIKSGPPFGIMLLAIVLVVSFPTGASAEQFQLACKPLDRAWENIQVFDFNLDADSILQTAIDPTLRSSDYPSASPLYDNNTPSGRQFSFSNQAKPGSVVVDAEYIKIVNYNNNGQPNGWIWRFDRKTGILTHLADIKETYGGDRYNCEKGLFVPLAKPLRKRAGESNKF
jgi:hypothetical protein